MRLDPDGKAIIYSGLAEHGTGQRSNICKMVAEILQIPLERVSVIAADSSINPFEFGPVGSRGTYAIGSAVIEAAENAKKQLFDLMAPKFKVTPEELATVDGMVYVKGKNEEKLPWIAGLGYHGTCLGRGRFQPDFTLPNFMMIFTEVEVDTETGKVDLIRVVSATDVGQIIDPPSLINQLNGCLGSAGIDSALFEETVLDTMLGRIMNPNMIDYKWRTFAELPEMEHAILETPFPSHRFHAIGVGEIAPSPGPSAVLMAVANAIGVRIYDYPLTPDKILSALGKMDTLKKGEEDESLCSCECLLGGEVIQLLAKYQGKAKLNAGGTDILGVLKDRILPDYPELIINIKTITQLNSIEENDERLRIGALTPLINIIASPLVEKTYSILKQAAVTVASPQIRNMATMGGNLCQDTRCWYYRYPDEIGGMIKCFRKGERHVLLSMERIATMPLWKQGNVLQSVPLIWLLC
ncbi:MAG: molybdopterin-dependent oxidoreductase [Desulfosporosinus sp.]|nr:molybdopterin-dependent oxidoreductase [Desulfosporosinus sp.]